MFGLFYMAANAIAYIISGTGCAIEDHQSKERAIQKRNDGKNIENLYMDHRGTMRDITTNQIRHVYADKNGDAWLEDVHGRKIRNLSEEKRNIEFREQVRENSNRIAVEYDSWTRKNSRISDGHMFKLTGTIFKDVRTGDLYIEKKRLEWDKETLYEREIGRPSCSANFYMKVSDGMLVCLSDSEQPDACVELHREVPSEEEVERFIEFFNQKQREGGWKNARLRESGREYFQKKDMRSYYLER